MATLILLLLAALLLSIILLILGMRGRRIDDHPLCRKCKYDLVGTTDLPDNCPECGSDLSKHLVTRIGNRKRKRKSLVAGLLIFTASLTIAGLLGWAQSKNFDWYPYKPLFMLQSEIEKDPGIKGAKKATTEIFKRLKKDKLSDRQVRNIVNNALNLQTDPDANWNFFWGDFLEEAWLKGKVEDEILKKYFKFIFDKSSMFEIRSKVRPIDWTLYRFMNMPKRAGSGKRFQAIIEYGQFKLDGETLKESDSKGISRTGGPGGIGTGSNLEFPEKFGKYILTTSQQIWICPNEKLITAENKDLPFKERWKLLKSIAACSWSQNFTKQIEVVGEDDPVLEQVNDESLAQEIQKQLKTLHCSVFVRRAKKDPHCLIFFGELPEAVSFDVYWRVGNKEWLVTSYTTDSTGLN